MAVEEHLSCKSSLATALFLWTSTRCPSFAVNHLKIISVRSPYQLFLDVQNHAYNGVSYNKVLNLYFESEPWRIPAKPRLVYLQRLLLTRALKGFSFGSNLRFVGRQSTLTMVFTRWPRDDSFPVSRALGGTCWPFKPFLQYFATGCDSCSCQDYEEYEYVECLSEKTQIIDLFTHYKLQPHKLSQYTLATRNHHSKLFL